MKSTSQTRFATIAFLSLLLLLAFALGAQAAAAAHYSDGSAVTTPPAGTQGRGGVDAGQLDAIAAAAPSGSNSAAAVAARLSHGRGALPVPQAGNPPTAGLTSPSSGSPNWAALAAIAAVLAATAIIVWALSRRARQKESSVAEYCAYHPNDPICGAG